MRQKGERIGRNPKTGEEVPILPRRVLVFRPSHVLKNRINDSTVDGDRGHGRRPVRSERWRRGKGAGKSAAAFRTISEVASRTGRRPARAAVLGDQVLADQAR